MKDGKRLFMQVAIFDGNALTLNVDTGAMGEGRVGILKADGTPLPAFTTLDCDIVNGDWFNKVVTWKGNSDVSSLAGQAVRLCFEMRGARLYALQFKKKGT